MPFPRATRRTFLQAVLASSGLAAWRDAFALTRSLPTPAPAGPLTVWSGAITADSATVKAWVGPEIGAQLVIYPIDAPLTQLTFPSTPTPAEEIGVRTFELAGLTADTAYEYCVKLDRPPGARYLGRLRTFPAGAASFRFAFSSCAQTASEHPVFTTIKQRAPLFMLHLGDFHYSDIAKNNPVLFRGAWKRVLGSKTQGSLYRKVPLISVWDDHDFGGNNSTGDSPSREAARRVYQEFAAHYPLPAGTGDVPIHQAFTVGRVRFILTDLRSERSSAREKDPAMRTAMGAAQKAWFKQELLAAKAGGAGLIIWGSSVPYIGRAGRGDSWGFFDIERRELADFIKTNAIENLLILCGDAHMCAVDDGSNAAYATNGGGAPLAVLHGSSLDRSSSFKGGPYSHGWYLPKKNEGCFGWVEVNDDGTNIRVDFSARNQRDVVRMQFSVEV